MVASTTSTPLSFYKLHSYIICIESIAVGEILASKFIDLVPSPIQIII